MKFLAIVLALVISADAIKVKQEEAIKDKFWNPFSSEPYYQWTYDNYDWDWMDDRRCRGDYGKGNYVNDSYCER